MVQWPEEASRQAVDDFERMLPRVFGHAHARLSEHGEFWPFAVVVDVEGHQNLAGFEPDRTRPGGGEVLAELRHSLRASDVPLRAVALTLDVFVPELGSDTIEITCEHLGSPTCTLRRPYTRRRFGGRLSYRPDVLVPGTPTVLTD